MNQNKLILIGTLVLIIILLIFNLRIGYLSGRFDKYCTKQYDPQEPCPCQPSRAAISNDIGNGIANYEKASKNFSFELLYTENTSGS